MNRIRLFWTGGWDSTFRLLQLLHDTDVFIQPIYLLDKNRNSTTQELQAMWGIRRELEQKVPKEAGRILPTKYGSFQSVSIKPHHQKAREELEKQVRIGVQYPILASFLEQKNIERAEIGIHALSQREGACIASLLKPLMEPQKTPAGEIPVLSDYVEQSEKMFERFTFPLISYKKIDMRKEAEDRGWMPIMKKTVFCFTPVFGLPCGVCYSCRELKQESGMRYRLGYLGPLLSFLVRPKRRLSLLLDFLGVKEKLKPYIEKVNSWGEARK